ncbi:MAG: rod shape-determining protein RodA [Alphaproteobacteria bacterium]|nr:MAG: rod shape-determining protein RodA [Alphaproteobacteria bacterium]
MSSYTYGETGREVPLWQKFREIDWWLIFLLCAVAAVGFIMLYSTGWDIAKQMRDPSRALTHLTRFSIALVLMFIVALVDVRVWMSLAYPAYAAALILLIGVELFGTVGMGAQRWLLIGPIRVQPSEVMKIALVLSLARYLHGLTVDEVSRIKTLAPAVLMILLPVALIFRQPDLGTALLLLMGGAALLFLAGLSWRIVAVASVLGGVAAGFAWRFLLQDYQKQRVLTALNPDSDPLGAGYHIAQSKIAIGAGGLFGKGFGNGSQSQLNFLPEKHTDFIFTMLAEEWGLIGALTLLVLYLLILFRGLSIAMSSRHHFGRMVSMGVMFTFFLYVAINTAMVMGLIPVVGVPLPLVSYGGTVMMTIMIGMGLVMSVHIHRDIDVPRHSGAFW